MEVEGAGGRPPGPITPDAALSRLKQGNADFLADKVRLLPRDHARRVAVAREQSPFAVLVGCSDSRVSPELLFGVGLGELFIVRNAGNTVGEVALGSVEYAVLVLGVPLVVVLGHQRCGAVQAAVDVVERGTLFPGSIGRIIEPILPAVLRARRRGGLAGDVLLETSVEENVRQTVERLRTSEPSLMDPIQAGKLRVVGAKYSLDEGRVNFFIE
jgi:carbonic anhydrase